MGPAAIENHNIDVTPRRFEIIQIQHIPAATVTLVHFVQPTSVQPKESARLAITLGL